MRFPWTKRHAQMPAAMRSAEIELAPRLERAIVMLAAHSQQMETRLDGLERRLEDLVEQTFEVPSHADVMEVRMHAARLAAELARVTVELRHEIDETAELARARAEPVRKTLAQQIIELTEPQPGPSAKERWPASA